MSMTTKTVLCPRCKQPCKIHVNERRGEGEDEDGNLIATHCLEAWAECPRHGWVSPKMDIRTWGEEKPIDEDLDDHEDTIAKMLDAMAN